MYDRIWLICLISNKLLSILEFVCFGQKIDESKNLTIILYSFHSPPADDGYLLLDFA